MLVQSAHHVPTTRVVARDNFRWPKCPRCGSTVLMAEQSRFDVKGRIDHIWSCDDCGNEFITSIEFFAALDSR